MPRTILKKDLRELYDKFDRDIAKRGRFYRVLLAIDQLGNVLLFNGSQDETISSYIGRTGKAKWLCNILKKIEDSHCYKSRGE